MRKPALYSRAAPRHPLVAAPEPGLKAAESAASVPVPTRKPAWRRHALTALALALCSALLVAVGARWGRPTLALSQADIDAAVLRTLTTRPLPSPAARAAERVRPAVVRIVSYVRDKRGALVEGSVGTGLVIVDKGVILTNLHVVQSAHSIKLVFADGSESGASVTSLQAHNDLAVLQAHTVPDDLQAATLRSTVDLVPGDEVVAVGFPFGIGPSVSSGVISGFKRSFRAPEGQHDIENLIQFDAAANPGNSGGPLVTMDGEVVGVVTGILNPSSQRTFVGIGFAVPIESAASAAGLPPF
jgi:S1-C subfamily serine protease